MLLTTITIATALLATTAHHRLLASLRAFCKHAKHVHMSSGETKRQYLASWPAYQLELARILRLEKQRMLALALSSKATQHSKTPSSGASLLARIGRSVGSIGKTFHRTPATAMVPHNEVVMRDIVLVGGGHSHVHVLRTFGMRPEPGVRLTLITRDIETPYSGMLPGYVAGSYTRRECHIDLGRLAAFARATLVHAEVVGVDATGRRVLLRNRPPIAFDVLSINTGSTPTPLPDAPVLPSLTPVKPIDGFCARWDAITARVVESPSASCLVVVGGGAGGVELALSMQARLRRELEARGRPVSQLRVSLVSRAAELMPQHSDGVRAIFRRILDERGVELLLNAAVVKATADELTLSTGDVLCYDEAIWCTHSSAPAWLRESDLALDGDGFVAVEPTLRSTSHEGIFAAGDVAAVLDHPRPKAGVFAVRQGPPLADNLRRAALGKPLAPFVPQTTFLGLIGTGDGGCVASKGVLALEAPWLWELKDSIDRQFMALYSSELPEAMEATARDAAAVPEAARAAGPDALDALAHASMRCGGCGAKVGATTLSRVLARLRDGGLLPPSPPRTVLVGLDSPDDCAVLAPSSLASVHSVDFFRAFIDDPFVFGKVAANHALSDCHAMGAPPTGALAIAVVPYGLEPKVEETLFQMMAGACEALREAKCALLGGHTCEGAELSLGLSVVGQARAASLLRKGGMRAGDVIILTKPIGTGALFAAHMRGAADGPAVAAAIDCMSRSNAAAAGLIGAHSGRSCTDVTGFGLLGHLHEMSIASNARVRLRLSAVPLLPGVADCVKRGIFSSLQPSNLRLRRALTNEEEALVHPSYPLLFDPQTAGGLLAAVPAPCAAQCIDELRASGYHDAAVIGEVLEVLSPEEACPKALIECDVWRAAV